MQLNTFATYGQVTADLSDKTVIVIDVLRATTTIVTALACGAEKVTVVSTAEEALKLRGDNVILGGEVGGLKIPGFDRGNSPQEYTPAVVMDKQIVMCTTNGTRALNSAKKSRLLLAGACVNAQATVDRALAAGDDIIMICSGTNARLSTDDIYCAGCLITKMLAKKPDAQTDDLSMLSVEIYNRVKSGASGLLSHSQHYNTLKRLGFDSDLNFCFVEDRLDTVVALGENLFCR